MAADRITIDVARTRGTRWAQVRVHVAPRPAEPGCAYRAGHVMLPADFAVDRELAASLATAVLDMIERQALLYRGPAQEIVQDPLPL